jgi:hypothetical protein
LSGACGWDQRFELIGGERPPNAARVR